MPSEEIEIKLTGDNSSYFSDLERRFGSVAQKFAEGVSTGLASSVGKIAGGVAGPALSGASQGAAAAVAQTPLGATASQTLSNAEYGAGKGAAVGLAGSIPGVGAVAASFVERLFSQWERPVAEPVGNAAARIDAHYLDLARHGIPFNAKAYAQDLRSATLFEQNITNVREKEEAIRTRLEQELRDRKVEGVGSWKDFIGGIYFDSDKVADALNSSAKALGLNHW